MTAAKEVCVLGVDIGQSGSRRSLQAPDQRPLQWIEGAGLARVFGDDTVAAAMIERLVHHADLVNIKGDSYRLKNRDLGRIPAAKNTG